MPLLLHLDALVFAPLDLLGLARVALIILPAGQVGALVLLVDVDFDVACVEDLVQLELAAAGLGVVEGELDGFLRWRGGGFGGGGFGVGDGEWGGGCGEGEEGEGCEEGGEIHFFM